MNAAYRGDFTHTIRKPSLLGILIVLLVSPISGAVELKRETLAAWDEYIRKATSRVEGMLPPRSQFLWVDEVSDRARRVRQGEIVVSPVGNGNPKSVTGGLIHDWIGAVFVPKATIDDVLSVVHDYNRYREVYRPTVIDSTFIARSGEEYKFSMVGLKRVLFEAIVLQGEFESRCHYLDGRHVYCISQSTRLQEIQNYGQPDARKLPPDTGHGYLWRLHSITKFEERDGGVFIELETSALSRDIATALAWVMKPVVRRVSQNSISTILRQTQEAVRSRVSSLAAESAGDSVFIAGAAWLQSVQELVLEVVRHGHLRLNG
jgi:hypothetical protein